MTEFQDKPPDDFEEVEKIRVSLRKGPRHKWNKGNECIICGTQRIHERIKNKSIYIDERTFNNHVTRYRISPFHLWRTDIPECKPKNQTNLFDVPDAEFEEIKESNATSQNESASNPLPTAQITNLKISSNTESDEHLRTEDSNVSHVSKRQSSWESRQNSNVRSAPNAGTIPIVKTINENIEVTLYVEDEGDWLDNENLWKITVRTFNKNVKIPLGMKFEKEMTKRAARKHAEYYIKKLQQAMIRDDTYVIAWNTATDERIVWGVKLGIWKELPSKKNV